MKRIFLFWILPCLGATSRCAPEAKTGWSRSAGRRLGALLALWALGVGGGTAARAQEAVLDVWEINISPYAIHFTQTDEHKHVFAVALQKVQANGDLAGVSLFSNSFAQPSAYGFIGRKYARPFGLDSTYVQWTAGVLYGYKGKYQNKVPLNANGFSPGFIPSIGYQLTEHSSVQLTFLGNSALMFNWTLTVH